MDNQKLEAVIKQNKKLKRLLTIMSIVLFIALSFIVYILVYSLLLSDDYTIAIPFTIDENTEIVVDDYLDTEEKNNGSLTEEEQVQPPDTKNVYDITFWDSSIEKNIGINIEGFEETDEAGNSIWPYHIIISNDPEHLTGSLYETLSFYPDFKTVLQVNADDIAHQITTLEDLNEVKGSGNAYYLKRVESDGEDAPRGLILITEPSINVQGYKAIRTVRYYNLVDMANGDASYRPNEYSTIISTSCLISLDQVDPDSKAYIEFSGNHTGGEMNYCNELDSLKEFSITTY